MSYGHAIAKGAGVDLREPMNERAEALIPRHLREALAELAARTADDKPPLQIAAECERWGDSPTSYLIRRAIAQQIASRGPLRRAEAGTVCIAASRTYRVEVDRGQAVARYELGDRAECVLCEGTLRLDGGAPCAGAQLGARCHRFDDAEVPGHYAQHGPELLPDALRLELGTLRPGQRGWWLTGPVGPGKTAMACAALRVLTLERRSEPLSCRYVDVGALLAALRAAYDAGSGAPAMIARLIAFPVLVLDDVGKLQGSGRHELRVLDELITARYNAADVTTFVTSNLGPDDLIARVQATEDLDLERILSRLAEMAEVIAVDGTDRRRMSRTGAR